MLIPTLALLLLLLLFFVAPHDIRGITASLLRNWFLSIKILLPARLSGSTPRIVADPSRATRPEAVLLGFLAADSCVPTPHPRATAKGSVQTEPEARSEV